MNGKEELLLPIVNYKSNLNLDELVKLIERGSIDVITCKDGTHYGTYYNQERKRLMIINEIREINYRIKRARLGFGYYDDFNAELMSDESFSDYIKNLKEYKKELYRYLQKVHDSEMIDEIKGDTSKEKLMDLTNQVSMYID